MSSPRCVPVAVHWVTTKSPLGSIWLIWKWRSGKALTYLLMNLRAASRPIIVAGMFLVQKLHIARGVVGIPEVEVTSGALQVVVFGEYVVTTERTGKSDVLPVAVST